MAGIDTSDPLFDAVATVFAATVLLDERQRDVELVEFTHACVVHSRALRPQHILCREQVRSWFDTHSAEIAARLLDDEDGSYRTQILQRIEGDDLRRSVLSSVFAISVSDYELHDEETAFIGRALRLWGVDLPSPKDIEAVA